MKLTKEGRERAVFEISFWVAVLDLFLVLALVAAEAYVRWSINQSFTFLGGFELPALTLSAFGLLVAIAWIHRSK